MRPHKTNSSSQQAYFARLSSFTAFLRDHSLQVLVSLGWIVILVLFLLALKVSSSAVMLIVIMITILLISNLIVEYLRRARYYRNLLKNLTQLDQAYLLLETVERPEFFDGRILQEILLQIDKSVAENIQQYASKTQDFREYIELWIHEAKTPLATLNLLNQDPRAAEQLKRLDDYIEQVLYFVRAENAEHDYRIKQTELAQVVQAVALRNREIIQTKQIELEVDDLHQSVFTDAKWLEFILNQIIANSIKYSSQKIKIYLQTDENLIKLNISDDGIGIPAEDLPRVFEKSFTGRNGRQTQAGSSTGMGLYLVRTLCQKLGHQISLDSQIGVGTTVTITFSDQKFYNVIDSREQ